MDHDYPEYSLSQDEPLEGTFPQGSFLSDSCVQRPRHLKDPAYLPGQQSPIKRLDQKGAAPRNRVIYFTRPASSIPLILCSHPGIGMSAKAPGHSYHAAPIRSMELSLFTKESRLYRSIRPSVYPDRSTCAVLRDDRVRSAREPLTESGAAFLAHMAGTATLAQTAEAYPYVINRLAVYGNKPRLMIKAIDRLLSDDLPGRRGFPPEIVHELSTLRAACDDHAYGLADSGAELAA